MQADDSTPSAPRKQVRPPSYYRPEAVAARREYKRKWAAAHPDKAGDIAKSKKYRLAHPDRELERQRKYNEKRRADHKENPRQSTPEEKARHAAVARAYRAANKESHRTKRHVYYETNKERFAEHAKRWRDENRERSNAIVAASYQRHSAKIRTESREYYKNHTEKYAALNKKWRAEHPGYATAHGRKWQADNPDKIATFHAKRAARLKGGGSFTATEWRSLLDECGHVCVCCGIVEANAICRYTRGQAIRGRLTVDHIIPISKNGPNVISNLQPLCSVCQHVKFTTSIDYRPRHVRERFRAH